MTVSPGADGCPGGADGGGAGNSSGTSPASHLGELGPPGLRKPPPPPSLTRALAGGLWVGMCFWADRAQAVCGELGSSRRRSKPSPGGAGRAGRPLGWGPHCPEASPAPVPERLQLCSSPRSGPLSRPPSQQPWEASASAFSRSLPSCPRQSLAFLPGKPWPYCSRPTGVSGARGLLPTVPASWASLSLPTYRNATATPGWVVAGIWGNKSLHRAHLLS